MICSKKYLSAITKYNAHELCFSNLVFYNFRMIMFHHQKSLPLNFIIPSTSLPHYVSTKTFIEYLFSEYLCFFWFVLATDVFCKKGVLKNFANFTGKHFRLSLFLIKLQTQRSAFFLKKRLHHSCFPVNIANFSKTTFCMKHLWWLLLKMVEEFLRSSNVILEDFVQKNL